jgi:5-methylcytosine-specific restriction endonuclease McrA
MRTLVLNAGYEPLAVVSFKRALVLVMNGKATVVNADRPSVIILRKYVRLPYGRRVPVSRRGVLRRDDGRCGYCGGSATTIDHVQPRSRGGADSWENLVACCLGCNNIKGDRTPAEMNWTLRAVPKAPFGGSWTVRGIERALPDWDEFLAPAA